MKRPGEAASSSITDIFCASKENAARARGVVRWNVCSPSDDRAQLEDGQVHRDHETTGALDTMLQKIADFYEDEVDNMVNNLMSLLEPAVILFLGVVIGGLVISMYLPIFKLGAVMDG